MELEGQTLVEGPWVDSTVGLDGVRADIAMLRTPDGHGRVELTRFHTAPAVRAEPESAPANALGIRRIMFAAGEQARWLLPTMYGPDRQRSQHEVSTQIRHITHMLRRAASAAPANVCTATARSPLA